MFTIISASKTIHRTFKPSVVYSQARGFLEKKERGFLSKYIKFRQYTVEDVRKLNLAPKDYEVIYINQVPRLVTAGLCTAYFFMLMSIYNFHSSFSNPDWSTKGFSEERKSNADLGIAFFFHGIIILFVISRNVKFIFRNDESVKYVFFGLLGRTKTVDYGLCACDPPTRNFYFFHYINKKRIVLIPKYFLKEEEYHLMLKQSLM